MLASSRLVILANYGKQEQIVAESFFFVIFKTITLFLDVERAIFLFEDYQ